VSRLKRESGLNSADLSGAQPNASAECLADIDVFVIAGGLGTRIQPVLGNTPKLLAPISGRPYLDYLLDWLMCFGAKRVVLGLGHQAQAVIDFLSRCNNSNRALTIESVIEPRPLGTAGAIRFAREKLRTDPVLIMNGDSFADVDLCPFVQYHRRIKSSGTLLCTQVDDASRYGRVDIDRSGLVREFIEKDFRFYGAGVVNSGVYLFSASLLDRIADGAASSLEREVFTQLPFGSLSAFVGNFSFIDIGTPGSLAVAEKLINKSAGAFSS
jgi:NDP-sugar pyrophosphorylase family protein